MDEITIATALIGGYGLGSIPFGLILTKLAGLGDIRAIGSGNIGATNVLRTGNKALALATLLLDGGKGAAAAALALWLAGPLAMLFAACGAMLGHVFPVWLRFKGGKGVATALGVLWTVCWPVGLTACLLWLLTAFISRISSLSALVAIGMAPLAAWYWADPSTALMAGIIAVLVFLRHADNIRRLLAGQEPRIGQGKAKPTGTSA